jgi:hypothetical protein
MDRFSHGQWRALIIPSVELNLDQDKDAYIRNAWVLSRLLVWHQQTGKSWTEPTFHEPRKRSEAKLRRQCRREGRTGQGLERT